MPPLFQLWAGQRRIVNKGALDPLTDGLVLADDFDLRVLQIGDVEACRVARAATLALAASLAATSVALVLDHADLAAGLRRLLSLLVGGGWVWLILIALTLRDACATAHFRWKELFYNPN